MSRLAKKTRTIDPGYVAQVGKHLCFACGEDGPNDAHHVLSRGAGGGDDWFNLIPLCRAHHTAGPKAWHNIGPISFLNEFPHVEDILRSWGWKIGQDKIFRP